MPIARTGRSPEGWLLPTPAEARTLGGICYRLGDPIDAYPETMQTEELRAAWLSGWNEARGQ